MQQQKTTFRQMQKVTLLPHNNNNNNKFQQLSKNIQVLFKKTTESKHYSRLYK